MPFYVHCHDFVDYNPIISFHLFNQPKLLLPIFDEALHEAQEKLRTNPAFIEKHRGIKVTSKPYIKVRLVNLPPLPSYIKSTIGDIRADDETTIIQVSGTIVRTGSVRMLEVSKEYQCQKCKGYFTVTADPEQDYMLPHPRICLSTRVTTSAQCSGTQLNEIEGGKVCVDYQEIKIQDQIESLALGCVPRSAVIILEADLVDKYNAGDDVIVVGTVLRQWKPLSRGNRCVVDIAIRANSIKAISSNERLKILKNKDSFEIFDKFWLKYSHGDDAFTGRDVIIRSICPQLFGLFMVKLALLLTLVGGSATHSDGGVKRRAQSHLLLVGDPGCGKSQLLKFAVSTSPRSVFTTGIGTTGAGLTCTAVKDGPDWSIEAGALVLANDGVCCIDEFASIKEGDLATIHEAMEQQTLSVAKAGLLIKLNTKATVIACCNPKGTYDITADLTTNTAIASPLLSRFDLVLVLIDSAQKDWDLKVSTYLLQEAIKNSGPAGGSSSLHDEEMDSSMGTTYLTSNAWSSGTNINTDDNLWNLETLRQYIALIKSRFNPVMSAEAKVLLARYYQLQRQSEDRSSARTTVRLLESLMRLSEAHARIMFREEVLFCDAVVAIKCMTLSQTDSSVLSVNSTLHSDFPTNPQQWYLEQEDHVLRLLGCTKDTILKEAVRGGESTVAFTSTFTSDTSPSPCPTTTDAQHGYHNYSNHQMYAAHRGSGIAEDYPGHDEYAAHRGSGIVEDYPGYDEYAAHRGSGIAEDYPGHDEYAAHRGSGIAEDYPGYDEYAAHRGSGIVEDYPGHDEYAENNEVIRDAQKYLRPQHSAVSTNIHFLPTNNTNKRPFIDLDDSDGDLSIEEDKVVAAVQMNNAEAGAPIPVTSKQQKTGEKSTLDEKNITQKWSNVIGMEDDEEW